MELIGEGGVWKIYKIENTNNILRIPKGFTENSINKFIENYRHIKKIGLPTLENVERYEVEGKVGVMCNNVNYSDERIYVTHNSLYSDSQKLLHMLSKNILRGKEERESSIAEDFRYKNKIDEITNFEEFVTKVKSDLKQATKHATLIEFDSYFFGTLKQSSITEIDYMIVDLDHIFTNKDINEDELFDLNLSEFSRAIKGFIKYFVTENNQGKYMRYLDLEK